MKSELVRQAVRDGRNVIEYQIQPGEMMDGLVLKKCKEGKFPGILPMGAIYENQHNYMFSYTDDMETLSSELSDVVSQKTILTVFESIAWTLNMLREEEVNLAYIVLDSDYIFIDKETGKAKLVCMPAKMAADIEDEIAGFFRKILANAVYLNSEDGGYVAKLLSALNNDFELKSYLRTIHGLMMDANIEIIEEKVETIEEKVETSPEIIVQKTEPQSDEPVAEPITEPRVTIGVVPEEEIEFEPIPEELNAKIERMNNQTTVEPEAVVQPIVEPQAVVQPQASVQPIAEPQTVVQPEAVAQPIVEPQAVVQPQVSVQPIAEPQAVVQPQASVQPIAEPQAVVQPQVSVQPIAEPQPVVQPESVVQPIVEPQAVVQPQASVQPIAEPQAVVQPQANVPPIQPQPPVQPFVQPQTQPYMQPVPPQPMAPGPRPIYMPSDVGIQVPPQQKQPSPHLIRVKTGEYISLPDGEFLIGKSLNGVDYTIHDNSAVSRVHCTIYKKNGAFYVRDEKSTNSTYVNGEQVLPGSDHLLTNNCKLHLGDEEFTFQLW